VSPRPEFAVHILNEQGKKKAEAVGQVFTAALNAIETLCGDDGREMAVVRTKMEESCFFAKKAMAKRTDNQVAAE
jgi:hypothetical protein